MQRIIITLLFVLFAGITLSAQDNAKYIGVWRAGNGSDQELKTGPNASGVHNDAGYTGISQYASRVSGKEVLNYGTFRRTRTVQKNEIYIWKWPGVLALAKHLKPESNVHIHNLEVSSHSSEINTWYHVIMKPGRRNQELVREVGWSAFAADWQTRTKRGMRLREIVVRREFGKELYVGLYEPGTGGHYLYNLRGWKAFTDKWAELAKKNYRLVEVETLRVGSNIQYIGVWAPGKDAYALIQVTGYQNFLKKFNEMRAKGLLLVDLDVIN